MHTPIEGFSKLTQKEKIAWLAENYTRDPEAATALLQEYWHRNPESQRKHEEFIENTLSNFFLPFAIAPNFLIDGKLYALPMVIEESSVVAAAGKAAKFWLDKGGFRTEILGTEKVGQVHFTYTGDSQKLNDFIGRILPKLKENARPMTETMAARGGGLRHIALRDRTASLPHYYQLHCTFDTRDAMGANFINSCLESFARTLKEEVADTDLFDAGEKPEVIMSILSNYVPECRVRAEVSCPVDKLKVGGMAASEFAQKMVQAVRIAEIEPYRAVTHNKGAMNGVDAVVLATGNDFRALEAGVHAYAARNGRYSSLSHAEIKDGVFRFWIELPLAVGTVGGLTGLHPMVQLSLDILQRPSGPELMRIMAVAGLAQNFAALRSLVTTGIQKGHMKMHLLNLLNQMGATEAEKKSIGTQLKDQTVSTAIVRSALNTLRKP